MLMCLYRSVASQGVTKGQSKDCGPRLWYESVVIVINDDLETDRQDYGYIYKCIPAQGTTAQDA